MLHVCQLKHLYLIQQNITNKHVGKIQITFRVLLVSNTNVLIQFLVEKNIGGIKFIFKIMCRFIINSYFQPPVACSKHKNSSYIKSGAVRTSLDLALDLQAFQRRLNQQQEEINRLKELKRRLEESKLKGSFYFVFKTS